MRKRRLLKMVFNLPVITAVNILGLYGWYAIYYKAPARMERLHDRIGVCSAMWEQSLDEPTRLPPLRGN
ncbi:hypothetical protein [Conchiformibius steedae]|uniref:hypothetical protein n=1 Tax=Conchiformibius steedae TaxID=153493 RepID=UPI0026EB1BC7|nr:hypothetical protein [Conchiformibius steedae]